MRRTKWLPWTARIPTFTAARQRLISTGLSGYHPPDKNIIANKPSERNDLIWQFFKIKMATSNHDGLWYNVCVIKRPNILLMVNSYQPERYLGIMRCAKEQGWQVTIESCYAPPDNWHGDGAIVNLLKSPELVRCVRRLRQKGIPVVDLSDSYPELNVPRVTEDNRMIGKSAAEHFRERGFTRCAFFSKEWTRLHELRFDGFRSAWSGEKPLRINLKNLSKLAAVAKPVAVFCFNDYNAQFLENECLKLGLQVPEDVAILGVDNNATICENVPVPLSSVILDFEDISYRGARVLANMLKGKKPRNALTLIPPSGIKVRRSSDVFTAEDPDAAKALDLIRQHLARPYGAPQIAAELSFSRVKVDRLFASAVGRSVSKEILRQRINKARRLLADTNWTLESIAAETGFCHASYFVKAFKKATGITPHKWRRLHRAISTSAMLGRVTVPSARTPRPRRGPGVPDGGTSPSYQASRRTPASSCRRAGSRDCARVPRPS